MPSLSIVGLSGNITHPSKTKALVALTLELVAERLDAQTVVYEVADFGPGLDAARHLIVMQRTSDAEPR